MFSFLFSKPKPMGAQDSTSSQATTIPAAASTAPSPSSPVAVAASRSTTTRAHLPPSLSDPSLEPAVSRSIFSERSLKQLGLFFAGAAFLALSTTVTRRSIARKHMQAQLKFYEQTANGPKAKPGPAAPGASGAHAAPAENVAPQGSLEAIEALNLATLNVCSFFLMMTGGVSWALDISSLDDLRRMARKHTRGTPAVDGSGNGLTDEEAEREVEEFVARILSRKKKDEGKKDTRDEPVSKKD